MNLLSSPTREADLQSLWKWRSPEKTGISGSTAAEVFMCGDCIDCLAPDGRKGDLR